MKILFTTSYRVGRYYDLYKNYCPPGAIKLSNPRRISTGLRFIRENIPRITILEYPLLKTFKKVIKQGWDIVGFSFYLNDIPRIQKMTEIARGEGVPELWGGNYGVLTPGMKNYFDTIIPGYAEKTIADTLGIQLDRLSHPELYGTTGFSYAGREATILPYGMLFSTRGCPMKCTFCQTPLITKEVEALDIDVIDRLLRRYKEKNIKIVSVLDDDFGILRDHADEVTRLFARHGLLWLVMTRSDILSRHVDSWIKRGLVGAYLGIETINQESLDLIKKGGIHKKSLDLISCLNRRGCFTYCFYIIGFPGDTKESLLDDFHVLKTLDADFIQTCILTPLPRTPLWDELDKRYTIFEKDWRRFDTHHLVWNHPHISGPEMRSLLFRAKEEFQTPASFAGWCVKLLKKYTLSL